MTRGSLTLLVLAIAVLAYIVARIASAPLQELAAAAKTWATTCSAIPCRCAGRAKCSAPKPNAMQHRLRRHLAERTQMLAAITHDLQTPLTRLRLRLENVRRGLRERLIGDLAAMQALVREGLELARSAGVPSSVQHWTWIRCWRALSRTPPKARADVVFEGGSGAVLMLRPLAMHRLFSNLVDNAVMYAQRARVRVDAVGVRSPWWWPMMARAWPEQLEAVFDPSCGWKPRVRARPEGPGWA